MNDPVFQNDKDGYWYFWNETWSDVEGPFESEEEARESLIKYSIEILGNVPETTETGGEKDEN